MFREIRTREKITEKDEKKEAWKKIKPKKEYTDKEIEMFICDIFNKVKGS